MDTMPSTSTMCRDRTPLLSRKISHKLATCSRAFQCCTMQPRIARLGRYSHVESSRFRVAAQTAEASVAFQSVDDSVWDERYAEEGPLEYGLATLQGPREEMEDYASIVPRGRCGFLYAGIHRSHLFYIALNCNAGDLLHAPLAVCMPLMKLLLQRFLMDMVVTQQLIT